MKRLFFMSFMMIATLLGMAPVFAGGQRAVDTGNGGKLKVVCTIFPQYDFVREIAGDKVDLVMLLPPGAESHSYEPTPQDIIKIQNCSVFIYVGGESDAWVERILDSLPVARKSAMKTLRLMDCVTAVEETLVEGMQGEAEEGEYDEHVWTSPRNAKLIVAEIAGVLCEADAVNAASYRRNAAAYLAKLDGLDRAFQDVVNSGSRRTLIFADRFPFRYFADAYGLDYFAAFPGCSTETEPSAATVAFLINKVRTERIPLVFYIEFSNERMADAICEATGAKKMLLHACHNVSKREFTGGATYLALMTQNVSALREALH
jgi:zinc transport system substrate-binding protein